MRIYFFMFALQGRSRSLTQIHNLDSGSLGVHNKHHDMDCKSEPGHPNDQILLVPPPVESGAHQKSPLQQSKVCNASIYLDTFRK